MANVVSERIVYSGTRSPEALREFCKSISTDCYILWWVGFSNIFVYKYEKLPNFKHAPSDYHKGISITVNCCNGLLNVKLSHKMLE